MQAFLNLWINSKQVSLAKMLYDVNCYSFVWGYCGVEILIITSLNIDIASGKVRMKLCRIYQPYGE